MYFRFPVGHKYGISCLLLGAWVSTLLLMSGFQIAVAVALDASHDAHARSKTVADHPWSHSFEQSVAHWEVQWDPTTGLARSGTGSPAALSTTVAVDRILPLAEEFVQKHAVALGIGLESLVRVRLLHSGRAWHITWQQQFNGLPVVGAFLDLTMRRDAIVVAFRSSLHPRIRAAKGSASVQSSLQSSRSSLGGVLQLESSDAVIVAPDAGSAVAVAAHELTLRNQWGGRWRVLVSRLDGRILQQRNLVRTESGSQAAIAGNTTAMVSPKYFQDQPVLRPIPWVGIYLDDDTSEFVSYSNRDGSFEVDATNGPHSLHANLQGRFVQVTNAAGDSQPHLERQATSPGDLEMRFDALSARLDERSIYYHVNFIHDFFKDSFGFDLVDFPVPAVAFAADPGTGDPNFPNAFWNGEILAFGNGGGTFFNMGLYSDVIYHEYTHVTTDFIYRPVGGLTGLLGDSMHEGLSDYFTSTINDEPEIGEKLSRDRSPYVRTLNSRLFWPDDLDSSFRPNLHSNGLILAAALWDLRQQLGATVTDALVHHARELLPRDFVEFLDAVQLQDDLLFGDAIPGNGSPHHDAILAAFGRRGIGPLGEGSLEIVHLPLGDIEEIDAAREVRAGLESFHGGNNRAVRVFWSTGEVFEGIWMQPDEQGDFVASIPGQAAGTQVRYYLAAAQLPPVLTATLPVTGPAEYFEYTVGPDTQPPIISHSPVQQHAAFTGAPRVAATIDDNMGIANAWLEYRVDSGSTSRVGFVPEKTQPQRFYSQLPVSLAVGRQLQYRIHATDLSRAAYAVVSPSQGWYELDIVENLSLGFESNPAGWVHEQLLIDRADSWQLSSANNHSPGGRQAWHVQTATAADKRIAGVLVTPSYRLEEAAMASIWSRIRATANGNGAVDAGQVQIQQEGASWQMLEPTAGYSHVIDPSVNSNYLPPGSPCLSGSDPEWRQLFFDLTPYSGRSVRLRFLFGSAAAAGIETSEWFLDDFQLSPGSVIPSDTAEPLVSIRAPLLQQGPTPNPFNPNVEFRLRADTFLPSVRLDIIDGRGYLVRHLLQSSLQQGTHRVIWDGRDGRGLASSSGVYYYLLESGLGRETGKLVLVR